MTRASSSRPILARVRFAALLVTLALPADARANVIADQQQPPAGIQQPTVRTARRGPAVHPEDAAVRVPLDAYIRGVESGEEAELRRAFLKDARLWWSRDGHVATRSTEEFIAALRGKGEGEDGPRRRITVVEVSGDVATATIEVEYETARFVDYLTLLKVGDEWRISNKAYVLEGRTTIS